MGKEYTLADYHNPSDYGGFNVFGRAVTELPAATAELAKEAWENPGRTAGHVVEALGTSAAMGAAIGYLVPSRGPASMILGAAFVIPMAWNAGKRLHQAYSFSLESGANQDLIARSLARDTISGTVDLGLYTVGGYAGAEAGYALAGSRGVVGAIGQTSQRGINLVENEGMLFARNMLGGRQRMPLRATGGTSNPSLPTAEIMTARPGGSSAAVNESLTAARPARTPEELPFGQRQLGVLNRRIEQYTAEPGDYNMYLGTLHGHSRYSDGMGLPSELFQRAREGGHDFTAITDHNHRGARNGVEKEGPRAKDQDGTPTIADDPSLYASTFRDAAAATVDGEFVALVGIELGTIGKVGGKGHKHFLPESAVPGTQGPGAQGVLRDSSTGRTPATELPASSPSGALPEVAAVRTGAGDALPGARGQNHSDFLLGAEEARAEAFSSGKLGGVNHINLFETERLFETVTTPRSPTEAFFRRQRGLDDGPIVSKLDPVQINNGDFRALVDHLDLMRDTTGNQPIIQLNHPRYRADQHPDIPASERGRDYGQKSFKSQREWRERFGRYVSQCELIEGGALTPHPVDVVSSGQIDPVSFAGYVNKGLHISPTFGRDFHYGDPVGNPGATGVMSRSLDKPSILEALRERRTIATTSGEKLVGTMWGNDRHPMGSILDQAAVPELSLRVDIAGQVVPDAKYKVTLWGDRNIGDGALARPLQEMKISGHDLIAQNGQVSFDPIMHQLGRKSAYYTEVGRTDPITGHTDRMWTAPIWVEPLAGAKHSWYMRGLTGSIAQNFPQYFR